MTLRVFVGSLLALGYNSLVGRVPCHALRRIYLKTYLAGFGRGTSIQTGCRFLNGRKVFFGERNAISFNCLFDGRHYSIRTGSDVSIGPEAAILTLQHDPQSADFETTGGDVLIGNRLWIA